MKCPKCGVGMDITGLDDFEVDFCPGCRGLWFQPEELSELRFDSLRAPFALDQGSAKVGRMMNLIDSPECPDCGALMTKERDPEQKHILYEYCPAGHGVFLDAGEFTDLARKTIWDKFKRAR